MSDYSTPRRMVKTWLQGEAPARPLLMPILFSLGARMENVPLRNFQGNPTKIANALRQIHNVLKVDGLACYFDRFLEAEALGCRREWRADGSCVVEVPAFSGADDLRGKLNFPEGLADKGNMPLACEVLRRVKVMLKDEPALMIRVTGPLQLARQLSFECGADSLNQDLVNFAAEVTASVARSFAEAGADVILLAEDFGAELPFENREWYSGLLAPVVNVIRFYEALPVLLLGSVSEERLSLLANSNPDCVLCPTLASEAQARSFMRGPERGLVACALPVGALCGDRPDLEPLLTPMGAASGLKPGLLTSAEDVAATADIKQLAERLKVICERLRTQPLGS
jgi:hypothetical protein